MRPIIRFMAFAGMLGMAVLASPARCGGADAGPPVAVPVGRLVNLANVPSQYVAPHDVQVWLPPGYPKQAPYAVLYMFDGQNLFGDDAKHWNRQSWHAARTAARLIATGRTRPFVIVAIANAGNLRMSEYFPQQPWQALTPAQRRGQLSRRLGDFQILPVAPFSDAFLKFLTQELKPMIDRRFAVDPARSATFVMGSSMGGLMAWYALAQYPQLFGGAACLSTHWIGAYLSLDAQSHDPAPDAFVDYIRQHFPSPADHRIYFDHGTRTLDFYDAPTQVRVDRLLRSKGWTGEHFESRVFAGADHSERSWAARLAIPMTFLLAPPAQAAH